MSATHWLALLVPATRHTRRHLSTGVAARLVSVLTLTAYFGQVMLHPIYGVWGRHG
jgi:hypothetical protein